MARYKFRYTLHDGQTGTGSIEAPCYEAVGMLVRSHFKAKDDVRVYDVEEVPDESTDTDS